MREGVVIKTHGGTRPAKDAATGPIKSIKRGNTTVSYHPPVSHSLMMQQGRTSGVIRSRERPVR